MSTPKSRIGKKQPASDVLRALSGAAFALQLHNMPTSPGEGDPIQIAGRIKAVLLHSKHGNAYKWLLDRLPIEQMLKHEANPVFTEIEMVRAAANAVADYLEFPESETTEQLMRSRKLRTAIKHVLDDAFLLSDSTRKELALRLQQLHWLEAVGKRGKLREQMLLFQLFDHWRLAFYPTDVMAATFAPLLVKLSGKDMETASREVRRHFAAFKKARSGEAPNKADS